MASSRISSEMVITVVEDATKQAPKVADAIDRMQRKAAALQKVLAASGTSDRLQKSLAKLGASETHVEALARAMRDYAKAEGLADEASRWTAAQATRYRTMEEAGVKAIRDQIKEEARLAHARHEQAGQVEGDALRQRAAHAKAGAHADNTVAGVASLYVAHRAEHLAVEVAKEYREFDKERRYSKVVLGVTDEQQRPLVDQAFSGGGMQTRYNAAQYLEGQRSLASRGYNKEQVLGLAPVTATLGQAFDLDKLEDGAKLLEGSMLGFGKDVSTKEAASANAMRTADLEVKSSKISGMTADDITMLLARGAPAAKAAHFSEEQLLAFGAALKKINISGDAAATAFIALTKNLQSPTHEARTALAAAGINYGKYQKVGKINEDGFASEVQRTFGGLRLGPGIRAGLHKIFTNDKIMADPAMYSGAVTNLLKRDLHGTHARDAKAIASLANRYRDDSVTSIDTQALFNDLQAAMAKNANMANTIFGSKQAGKIKAGTGEVFEHMLDELTNHSKGFAVEVSDAKMEGFNGALNVVTKSLSNLDMRLGMAFDGGGNGGFLTLATRDIGKTIDALSQLNPGLLRAGGEAVLLAGGLAALKSVDFLRGGFGLRTSAGALTGSATLLDGSAGLLDKAAIALAAAGAVKGAVPPGVVTGAAAGAGAATVAAEAGAATAATAGALAAGGKMAAFRTALAVGGRTLLKAVPEIGTAIVMYDAAKGGVDTAANVAGIKKNSQEQQDYLDRSSNPVFHPVMTVERLWAHLRGRNTGEEIALADTARKAASAPEAPPLVPKPPLPEEGDEADDVASDKEDLAGGKKEKPQSAFLARHPDFKRLDEPDGETPIAGKRASGGPVSRGKTYLVGEHGPELFTAGMNGAISTTQVQRLLSQDRASSVMIARPQAIATGTIVAAINGMHRDMVSGSVAVARQVGQPAVRHALPGEHPPIAGKRASGGPVSRGKTYLVGEHGPELFTAGMNGAISTTDVQRMLSRERTSSAIVHAAPSQAPDTRAIVAAIKAMHQDVFSGLVGVAREVGQLGISMHRADRTDAVPRGTSTRAPSSVTPIAGAHAAGGPVPRGRTYLVGEHGPELFTAGATGQVTNNRLLLQAVLSSRDFADRGQRTERNRLALSEVLAHSHDPGHLRHPATAGRVSTSISTSDVQRLLSKASDATRANSGDPDTAKAIRAMGFELARAVDGVVRAVDRADAHRVTLGGDFRGDTSFYGAEGASGHPRSFGGGGRRGFMEGGHGSEGAGRKGFAHRAAEGPGADVPTDGDSVKVATSMLKKREGFQGTAKWDKNHLRLGYGSDTITDAQGGVHEVKAGDHVTREDAERDLARRIPEFQRKIAQQVGPEAWKKLSPVVQGALTSMAYNYGGFVPRKDKPDYMRPLREAIGSGDNAKIAAAIRGREGDNGGINRERREEEARVIEHGGARPASLADAGGRVDKVTGGVGDRLASFKRAGVLSNEQCVELARRMVGDTGHVNTWRRARRPMPAT